jgi:hypothetical protein
VKSSSSEQPEQRARGGRRRHAEACAPGPRALEEDVDVPGLVRHGDGEQHGDLGVRGVDAREEVGGHVERRELVLGEERHHLREGVLERGRQRGHAIPGDVARRIPRGGDGLVVQLRRLGRDDAVAVEEVEGVDGPAGLYAAAVAQKPVAGSPRTGTAPRRTSAARGRRRAPAAVSRVRGRPPGAIRYAREPMDGTAVRKGVVTEVDVAFSARHQEGEILGHGGGAGEHREDAAGRRRVEGGPHERQQAAREREVRAFDRGGREGGARRGGCLPVRTSVRPAHHPPCRSSAATRET